MSHQRTPAAPTEPARVKAFARFFKGYMSLWSVVAAALPIPVTALRFIPTYGAHTKFLSTYASLFCFLLLGFIFYCRHPIARWMFYSKPRLQHMIYLLPFALILTSAGCVVAYHLARISILALAR